MAGEIPDFGTRLVERIRAHLRSIGKDRLSAINAETMARLANEEFAATKTKKKRAPAFVPPTPSEVEVFSRFVKYPLDGEGWCAFYETKDWYVGSRKMKDWRAAIKKWKAMGWTLAGMDGKSIAKKAAEAELPEIQGWHEFLEERKAQGRFSDVIPDVWDDLPGQVRATIHGQKTYCASLHEFAKNNPNEWVERLKNAEAIK